MSQFTHRGTGFLNKKVWLFLVFIFGFLYAGIAQDLKYSPNTNRQLLREYSTRLHKDFLTQQERTQRLAKEKGWPLIMTSPDGRIARLTGVDGKGRPKYVGATNVVAAGTTRTNQLYSGGSLGVNLSGSTIPEGKIAIIEVGGIPRLTHQEFFEDRVVAKDEVDSTDHATHVAGTIMAAGVNPSAKGMAYGLPKLWAFDDTDDITKMSDNAATLLLSNHSYGLIAGWYYYDSNWYFMGRTGESEDFNFGLYDTTTAQIDTICYLAPYYLPVFSAGNNRNDNGPRVGAGYYSWNEAEGKWKWTIRTEGMNNSNGYDIIATYHTAKNILTVGAAYGLAGGANKPLDVMISDFSSWGPTDDGRIKPDLVADGVGVLSSGYTADNSYVLMNGTSMAAPNTTGTLTLLQELYHQENGEYMRSSTVKALALGTTSEAGPNPGPDYMYGWGLLNAEKAGRAILDNGTKSLIAEETLSAGGTKTFTVTASGHGPLVATIAWTDPAGEPMPDDAVLNDPAIKLVNDLDIRASDGTTTYYPWILNPANPSAAATTGDNIRDNVEQIFIAHPVAGKTYTFTVTHKNSLANDEDQNFGIVITGIGGTAYCSSSSAQTGSKITNFNLGGIDNTPTLDCGATYTDFTAQEAQMHKGGTYELKVKTGACGAGANTIAKVYVDWNADGDFDDAGELVVTSGTLTPGSTYTTNITVPNDALTNVFSRIRVVLIETADQGDITACGVLGTGETHDYSVHLLPAAVPTRLYVKKGASGTGSGTSWSNAYTELGDAMDYANSNPEVTEIWVAAGVYKPTVNYLGNSDDRDKTFAFPLRISEETGLKIYGGFNGSETLLSQRDWRNNKTTLSGDFEDDDLVTGAGEDLDITGMEENAYHVVVANDYAVLDGFWIVGGGAVDGSTGSTSINGKRVTYSRGGAVSVSEVTGVKIKNSVLYGNQTYSGAGDGSSLGGAIYGFNTLGLEIENCVFENNKSRLGGGIATLHSSNSWLYSSSIKITNTVFAGNRALTSGGAITFNTSYGGTENIITNSTFYNNHCVNVGGGLFITKEQPIVLSNTVFSQNESGDEDYLHIYLWPVAYAGIEREVNYSIIEGDTTGTVPEANASNISGEDPLFKDASNPSGADGKWMTADDGLMVTEGSPAIDAGKPDIKEPATDITGYARKIVEDGGNEVGKFTLGAYEYRSGAVPVIMMDFDAKEVREGVELSWKVVAATDFSHFEIERSSDGLEFKSIGRTNYIGSGKYRELDNDIPAGQVILFYRLKMVDKDGTFKYSEVKRVVINRSVSNAVRVYPNPFKDNIRLDLSLDMTKPVSVSLFDMEGRMVYSRNYGANASNRKLTIDKLDFLKPGSYMVRVVSGESVYNVRVVKAN